LSSTVLQENEKFEKFEIPILIFHGKENKITSWENVRKFYTSISSNLKCLKLYDSVGEFLHEDYCTKEITDGIINWLLELHEKLELLD
jgi:esterase/lipase